MHLARATFGALALVVGSWLCAPPAGAQDGQRRAVELYRESGRLYERGQFAAAARLLREAFALHPDPTLLYNLARAYEGAGDLEESIRAYERFLAEQPEVEDRGAIERRIATLRYQIEERAALAREREASERARREAELRLRRSEARAGNASDPAPWVIGGIGVGGIAAGVILGAMALSRHGDAEADPTQAGAADAQSQAESFATASTVAFVAGGVLAAVGVTWIVVRAIGGDGDGTTAAEVGLGPGRAALTVRF